MPYTVKQLAEMAGVSVRTLHHYDAIGLVSPETRSASGYRLYGENELIRLQQALFYRELDMSLEEIGRLLDGPGFDPILALEEHKRLLAARAERLARLMRTVDRTIGRLKGETMLSDKELYSGFTSEEVRSIEAEVKRRWGETEAYAQSKKRVARMTKDEWARIMAEGDEIDSLAAELMRRGVTPDSPEAMSLMARKYEHLRHFYEPSTAIFTGLGRMYVEDERFKTRYENIATGLADYLRRAMEEYAASLP